MPINLLRMSGDVTFSNKVDGEEKLSSVLPSPSSEIDVVTAVQYRVLRQFFLTNDDLQLGWRVISSDGSTVIAANNSSGDYVLGTVRNSATIVEGATTSFPWFLSTATDADWSGAQWEFVQYWGANMGADGTAYINVIRTTSAKFTEIRLTYDEVVSVPTLTLPTETSVTDTTATVGCTTDFATGTLYYYVSTSATAPSAADLKAGTGAVDSGSQASPGVGTETFAVTGLSASTTYYTYFIHNDTGGDSNLLESGSWATTATAPVLTLPTTTNIADDTATVGCTTDTAAGDLYYVISTSATPPTAAEMLNPGNPEDIKAATKEGDEFDTGSIDIYDIGFNATGTKMYVLRSNDSLREYDLSPAWDISTAAFHADEPTNGTGGDQTMRSFVWVNSGNDIIMSGTSGDNIYKYDCSTAYDVTTIDWANGDVLDVGTDFSFTDPTRIRLNSAGTKLYMTHIDSAQQQLRSFDLSPAYDITSATHSTSDDMPTTDMPQYWDNADLTTDGTKIYMVDTGSPDNCLQWSLSTAWDVSTATYDGVSKDWDMANLTEAEPRGMVFRNATMFFTYGTLQCVIEKMEMAGGPVGYTTDGNVTSPGVGTETFNATGLTAETDYYTYFMHQDAGVNSNILSSTQWTTLGEGREVIGTTEALLLTTTDSVVQAGPTYPVTLGSGRNIAGTTEVLLATANDGVVTKQVDRTVTGTTEALEADATTGVVSKTIDRNIVCETEALEVTANDATVTKTITRAIVCETEALLLAENTGLVIKSREVEGTTEALALGTNPAIVDQARDIDGPTEALLLSENPAVVDQARSVSGTTEALLLTTTDATVGQDRAIVGTTEALLLTTNDATVTVGRSIVGTTEALLLTTNDAAIDLSRIVSTGTEALVLETTQASVQADRDIAGTTETLEINESLATVDQARPIEGGTESLLLTENSATVLRDREISGTTEAILADFTQAVVTRGVDREIMGLTEALVLTENTASVTTDRVVTGTTETLELTAELASVDASRSIQSTIEELILTAELANVDAGRLVQSTIEELILTESPAAVGRGRTIIGPTEELTISVTQGAVGRGRTITGTSVSLELATNPANVTKGTDRNIMGVTESLIVTANDAVVTKSDNRVIVGITEELIATVADAIVTKGTNREITGTTEVLIANINDAAVDQARPIEGNTEALEVEVFDAVVSTSMDRNILTETEELVAQTTTAAVSTSREVTGTTELLEVEVFDAIVRQGIDLEIAGETEEIILTARPALVGKGRPENTFPWYGREGVELVPDPHGVEVLQQPTDSVKLLAATAIPSGRTNGAET